MVRDPGQLLFFVALLPPREVQERVTAIKRSIAERHGCRAALKSPPHITLQPPFCWSTEALSQLEQSLQDFACDRTPIPIQLIDFGAFAPRVIYIDVLKTPELMNLQSELQADLYDQLEIGQPAKTRPFSPHITVAYRDLKPKMFKSLWPELRSQPFKAAFPVNRLTLLKHDGRQWQSSVEFSLGSNGAPGDF